MGRALKIGNDIRTLAIEAGGHHRWTCFGQLGRLTEHQLKPSLRSLAYSPWQRTGMQLECLRKDCLPARNERSCDNSSIWSANAHQSHATGICDSISACRIRKTNCKAWRAHESISLHSATSNIFFHPSPRTLDDTYCISIFWEIEQLLLD